EGGHDEHRDDRQEGQDGGAVEVGREGGHEQREQRRHQRLHQRVARRDAGAAGAAAAAQSEPRQHGHEVEEAEASPAAGTAAAGVDDRLAARQAVDDDVAEAADHRAEQRGEDDDEGRHARGPDAAGVTLSAVGRGGRSGTRSKRVLTIPVLHFGRYEEAHRDRHRARPGARSRVHEPERPGPADQGGLRAGAGGHPGAPRGAQVEELRQQAQAEIGELLTSIQALESRIAAGEELSPEDNERYQALVTSANAVQERYRQEIDAAAQPAIQAVNGILAELAAENGYTLIMDADKARELDLVVYADDDLDVTQLVVDRLNAQ